MNRLYSCGGGEEGEDLADPDDLDRADDDPNKSRKWPRYAERITSVID